MNTTREEMMTRLAGYEAQLAITGLESISGDQRIHLEQNADYLRRELGYVASEDMAVKAELLATEAILAKLSKELDALKSDERARVLISARKITLRRIAELRAQLETESDPTDDDWSADSVDVEANKAEFNSQVDYLRDTFKPVEPAEMLASYGLAPISGGAPEETLATTTSGAKIEAYSVVQIEFDRSNEWVDYATIRTTQDARDAIRLVETYNPYQRYQIVYAGRIVYCASPAKPSDYPNRKVKPISGGAPEAIGYKTTKGALDAHSTGNLVRLTDGTHGVVKADGAIHVPGGKTVDDSAVSRDPRYNVRFWSERAPNGWDAIEADDTPTYPKLMSYGISSMGAAINGYRVVRYTRENPEDIMTATIQIGPFDCSMNAEHEARRLASQCGVPFNGETSLQALDVLGWTQWA